MITGATGGIGFEIARGLAPYIDELILPARNQKKAEQVVFDLKNEFPELSFRVLHMDLSDLQTIRAMCDRLVDEGAEINLLVLNAGIIPLGEREPQVSTDGLDLVFETNYLANFALVKGLLPLLKAGHARVVFQGSLGGSFGKLGSEPGEPGAGAARAYQQSKIALGLFGMELDRRSRAGGWGISVQLAHPGVTPGSEIAPALRRMIPSNVVNWAVEHIGNSTEAGARPAIDAALTDSDQLTMFAPEKWFGVFGPVTTRRPFKPYLDRAAAVRLWSRSEQLLTAPRPQRGSQDQN